MSVLTSKARILPRIVAVIFAVFALIFSSVMVPQAHAAENTNIVVNISPLQKSLDSGSPTEGSVRVNELVRMDATWDASNANPQPGDTFTIPLPSEFESRQAGAKVDLKFEGKVVGECRSELKQVSCSLNDQITGMVDIKGTFYALLVTKQTTTTNEVTFELNGGTNRVSVRLPGNQPIGAAIVRNFSLDEFGKSTTPIGDKSAQIPWTVNVSSKVVEAANPGVTLDGTTVHSVTIHDVLTAGQKFNTELNTVYMKIGASQDEQRDSVALVYADGKTGPGATPFPGYSVKADFVTERVANFTLTGPFKPNTNYYLVYFSMPTNPETGGYVRKGIEFSNTASVEGTTLSKTFGRFRYDSIGATVEMKNGFGTFSATKKVRGDGTTLLTGNEEYEIEAHWTLPEGKTPASYGNTWTAPSNPVKLTGTAGSKVTYQGTFPAGTTITISEPNKPSVQGVQWEDPAVVVEGAPGTTKKDSFVIQSLKDTAFDVINTAKKNVGRFVIVKQLDGDPVTAPQGYTFPFSYTCNNGTPVTVNVPADGTPVFSDELPIGHTCVVTEGEPPTNDAFKDYDLTKQAAKTITISDTSEINPLVFVNTYKKHTGEVKVRKVVTNLPDAKKPQDFKVAVTYTVDGKNPQTKDVPANGTEVLLGTFPVGSVVAVTEETVPEIAGYSFTKTISEAVTVVKDTPGLITVTNNYTQDTGIVKVKKEVVAPANDTAFAAPANVTFTYTVDGKDPKTKVAPANGTEVELGTFPVGSVVAVTEETGAEVSGYSFTNQITPAVTVVKDTPGLITVTNTYTKDVGVVKVKKVVEAPANDAAFKAPEKVTIGYTVNGEKKSVEVPANATEVELGTFAAGTTVEITGETGADVTGYSFDVAIDKPTVTVKKDSNDLITVTNSYTKDVGVVKVKKVVEAPANDAAFKAPEKVTIGYTVNGEKKFIEVPANATEVELGTFAAGTTVEITGETGADVTGYSFDVAIDKPTVTVKKDSNDLITVTNSYTKDVGVVKVKKVVEGPANDTAFKAPAKVTLKYTVDGVEKTAQVPADGSEFELGTFATGSKVAIVGESDADVKGYSYKAKYGEEVVVGKDSSDLIEVKNTYTKNPVVEAKNPKAAGKSRIAQTGSTAGGIVGGAAALLVVGVLAVAYRRRH